MNTRLAKIYLFKSLINSFWNLYCVNSSPEENTHNTRKSPWEPSLDTSSMQDTQVTSAFFKATRLIHSCAQFISWTDDNANKTIWIKFLCRFPLLMLQVWNPFAVAGDGGDTEMLQMFYSQFYQQWNCLTSYTVVLLSVCRVTCGHLDTVWKTYKTQPWTLCWMTWKNIWITCEFTSKWLSHAGRGFTAFMLFVFNILDLC